jgi:serine protease Do
VTDVVKDSPAEKAGFQRGDIITEFEGKPVEDSSSLRNMVAMSSPGTKAGVTVLRDGKSKLLSVTLGELPEKVASAPVKSQYRNVMRGVHVQNLTPDIRRQVDVPKEVNGVIITDIDSDSAASIALRAGDVIEEINRNTINNVSDYEKVVSRLSEKESVLLLIYRGGGHMYVTISR